LAGALKERAVAFDPVVKSGRTHLQDAVPVRLGQEFAAYARAIERDAERIRRAGQGLRRLGIGGTATGTGLNAHPEYAARMVARLSERTGLELQASDDLFESMQSMADMADFSASLRTLAITLIRVANDVRLLASGPATGLDEIRLMGCDMTVALAAQAGQLELNVMMPVIAHSLFEMMQVVIGSVQAFTQRCVRGMQANPEKAEGWLARNAIVVTALNPLIGYSAGAALVQQARSRELTVLEVALELAAAGKLQHRTAGRPVTLQEVQAALKDLRRLTEGGIQA